MLHILRQHPRGRGFHCTWDFGFNNERMCCRSGTMRFWHGLATACSWLVLRFWGRGSVAHVLVLGSVVSGAGCGGCVRRVNCPCTYLIYVIFAIFITVIRQSTFKDSVLYSKKFLIKSFSLCWHMLTGRGEGGARQCWRQQIFTTFDYRL